MRVLVLPARYREYIEAELARLTRNIAIHEAMQDTPYPQVPESLVDRSASGELVVTLAPRDALMEILSV